MRLRSEQGRSEFDSESGRHGPLRSDLPRARVMLSLHGTRRISPDRRGCRPFPTEKWTRTFGDLQPGKPDYRDLFALRSFLTRDSPATGDAVTLPTALRRSLVLFGRAAFGGVGTSGASGGIDAGSCPGAKCVHVSPAIMTHESRFGWNPFLTALITALPKYGHDSEMRSIAPSTRICRQVQDLAAPARSSTNCQWAAAMGRRLHGIKGKLF